MPKAKSAAKARSKQLGEEATHPYQDTSKPSKPSNKRTAETAAGKSAFAYAGGSGGAANPVTANSVVQANTTGGSPARVHGDVTAAPAGALVPRVPDNQQFDLENYAGMPAKEILRKLGIDIDAAGKVSVRKKANGYRDSEISLFDGPVRGQQLKIKFADFNNETLVMKLMLTSATAASFRALQDAWFNCYLAHADQLAALDTMYVEASDWLASVKSRWATHHPDTPLPTDWRQIHGDPCMLKDKSGTNGPYKVNCFCADKFKDYGADTTLKVNYSKSDRNCGGTVRRIVNNKFENEFPIENVLNGDTIVKGRWILALGCHNGAPSFNIKPYNGAVNGSGVKTNFVLKDTGTPRFERADAKAARLANETPAQRAAREARERAEQEADDAAFLHYAQSL